MERFVILFLCLTVAWLGSIAQTKDSLPPKKEDSAFNAAMNEIVVSGTLRAVHRLESPVAVEVYSPKFLKMNPSPSVFEALQLVNGVRPQLNCNICNTGDIHINGLEGPYTMVTIDGMPIVSSLSSVYGLFGIPNQLIERIEVVKGPASGLYGSEAVGGLINIITKNPSTAPVLNVDLMSTTWNEYLADVGVKWHAGKKVSAILGVNYFNYQDPKDDNQDGFTDMALQHRISVFNKWSWQRKENRQANIAVRYFYEDRWGGEMDWSGKFRGTDSVYGESIYTNRFELIGNYQLPVREPILFSWSYNYHNQDSRYGDIPYLGKQHIGFGQFTWNKKVRNNELLTGLALRYNFYDDNSIATADPLTQTNNPSKVFLPGIFVQDEIKFSSKHLLLAGLRYDHHPVHGNIFTPRIAWKWKTENAGILRLNAGTGFRVVNLFTEEHAALTGAREVVINEELDPETSYNINLNYNYHLPVRKGFVKFDASAWYTYFSNQIIPDYDTDPNKIIYQNLDGYATSTGFSLNTEFSFTNRIRAMVGGTIQDIRRHDRDATGKMVSVQPVLTEKWSAVWNMTYVFVNAGLTVDYTGNLYGPMRLPLAGPLDPRKPYSPVWSIQNIQLTKKLGKKIEIYGGIKNLLDWTPVKGNPFIIARANDPFDKHVQYDANGQIMQTPDNPYALSFDPTYVYGPNQGRRGFFGVRMVIQ
ncbi:TonB-dependent receptor plug domain-containing protein [Pollutibacter soli]|uniref:TonB-dependent receptor plug domain-containing protein n=1 Tax=Pollutibacter soli TaxID=3034157 RepID=UPI003014052C